jgi:mono/diheme cytochrome c family protein
MGKLWKTIPLILLMAGIIYSLLGGFQATVNATAEGDDNDIGTFFIQRCGGCHGVDGHPSRSSVPDFTDPDFQREHTDEDIKDVILNGKPPRMPGYKSIVDETKAKALVAHIRSLAKKEKEKED